MQNVGCHMLHLYVAQQLSTSGKDAVLNSQFPFGIDLNKILPDLLILRTKAEKPDTQFSQRTYGPKAQSGSKLWS